MYRKSLAAGLLLACIALSPVAGAAQPPIPTAQPAAAPTPAESRKQVEAVVEAFRTAIIERDKPKFLALFPASGPVAWQSVIGDDNLRQMRLNKPQVGKANHNPKYSHLSFIDGIVEDKASSEETFDDIRIDTDGDIASVAFDYRFLQDGRETNRGREAWNLVRTDDGWKIVSVVWSMRWGIKPEGGSK